MNAAASITITPVVVADLLDWVAFFDRQTRKTRFRRLTGSGFSGEPGRAQRATRVRSTCVSRVGKLLAIMAVAIPRSRPARGQLCRTERRS